MSKGLGAVQRAAVEITKDGVTLITPIRLAFEFFGDTSDSKIRSARRALQTLAKRGCITRHGYSGGTGHAIYGGKYAAKVNLERAYAWAMSEFYKNKSLNLDAFGTLTTDKAVTK